MGRSILPRGESIGLDGGEPAYVLAGLQYQDEYVRV